MALQPEHLWGTAEDEPIGPEWAPTIAPDYFYTRAATRPLKTLLSFRAQKP